MHKLEPALRAGLAGLQLELSDAKCQQLLAYLEALQRWNQVYNLTAIRDPREMLVKHLFDSLSLVPHLPEGSLLDVGTGAGLPGLVLAIAQPERPVHLLDSNGKKVRFLHQMIGELRLPQVRALHQRVEQCQAPAGGYANIVSRAFSSLKDMITLCQHLMAEQGCLLAMKGQRPDTELAELPNGFRLQRILPLRVPQLEAERHLIEIRKE